ncbi:restriction endonuclease subunit S [uncultured Cytophaga sp.]|uniref:restriction endonuclease subunit S n=1 Tax=uncultured Cytophaga sp. TaxID=160238 RepID=UPI00260A3A26|nr:restriction endonuclease subunit S [uncultured Cytophaga sp.]
MEQYKLKEITIKIGSGSTPRGGDSAYINEGISLIRSQNVHDFIFSISGLAFINEAQALELKNVTLEKDDILVNITGDSVARVCKVPDNILPARVNQHVAILRCNVEKLNSEFLKYYLLQPQVKNELLSLSSSGATRKALTKSMLEELNITLPPLNEQEAIAEILSSLDDKIELNLQTNKTLEEMANALYKHWFVDGSQLQSTLSDYIELNPKLVLKQGIGAPFVEMKSVETNLLSVSNVDFEEFSSGSKFQNGDTLFARITPCLENGKTAFVDFLKDDEIGFGSTEFLVMRAKRGISKYMIYCLSRDMNFRQFAISTMVGTSGRQRVQNEPFLKYDLPEINIETHNNFNEQVDPWFKNIRANTIENQILKQTRDYLLPKLISGEIRVNEARKAVKELI